MRSSSLLEICRKVSVAPMMDWTDGVKKWRRVKHLARLKKSRSLYVTSTQSASDARRRVRGRSFRVDSGRTSTEGRACLWQGTTSL